MHAKTSLQDTSFPSPTFLNFSTHKPFSLTLFRALLLAGICLLILFSCSTSAYGGTCDYALGGTVSSWIDGNDNWSNGANWDNGVPNSSGVSACIDNGTLGTPTTVTLNSNYSILDLGIGTYDTLTTNYGVVLYVYGTQFINDGAFFLNGGYGSNTYVMLYNNVTLSGGGTFTLYTNPTYGGASIIQQGGGGITFTNESTIVGAGIIGNGGLALNNSGTINANASGQTLTLNGTGGITNTGLLKASGGGTLDVVGTLVTNAGGNITAESGSTVRFLANTQVWGGSLNNNGGWLGTPSNYGAYLDGSTGFGAVTINGTYTSDLNSVTYIAGTITNNGNLLLRGGYGGNTYLSIYGGNLTLQGGGTLTLSSIDAYGGWAVIQQNSGGQTLTNVDNTIQGDGIIGNNGLTLVNYGTINANSVGAGEKLQLYLQGLTSLTNQGLIEATNKGQLLINGVTVYNQGGTISGNGSDASVQFTGSAYIQGGTLTNNGAAFFGTPSSNTAYLDGLNAGPIALLGTYTSDYYSNTYLSGQITNNGTIQVNGGYGGNAVLLANSNFVTLLGGGTVNLYTNAAYGGNAIIQQASGGLTFDNDDNTIQGEGIIGNNGLTLVNEQNGVINANSTGANSASLALYIQGATVFNQGLMEATNKGQLNFNGVPVYNQGGTISANGPDAYVQFYGSAYIQGGTLTNNGGAFFGTTTNATAYLDGLNAGPITMNGTYTSDYYSNTYLMGTINNNGILHLNGGYGGNAVLLINSSDVLLQGGGTVDLYTNTAYNGNAIIQQASGGLTLTNVDNTIQGEGIIGNNGLTVINMPNGVINANSTGANSATYALVLQNATVYNQGLIEATNWGQLDFTNVAVYNQGGTIAGYGGNGNAYVQFYGGAYIQGGTLTNNGATFFGTPMGGTAYLDGLNAGAITINGTYTSDYGANTFLLGTVTNTGNIQLNGGYGYNSALFINSPTVVLQGGGTVTLNTNPTYGGAPYIQQASGGLTLENVDNTIQGQGYIGNNGLSLINDVMGTVLANVPGGNLYITGGGTITNWGTFQANPGSSLMVQNVNFTNFSGNTLTGGSYDIYGTAGQAGTLQINPLGNTGGEIVNNAASILLDGPNSNFVDAAGKDALSNLSNNSGSFTIQNGRNFTSPGSFANSGNVFVGSGSIFTSTGDYNQNGGSTRVNGTLVAGSGQANFNAGTLLGNLGVITGNVKMGGTLAPGDSFATAGKLTINGNYVQTAGGSFQLDIGGYTAGSQFDLLDITGNALLDGILNVSLINGFFPSIGDTFTFLTTGGSRSGQFATETGLIIGNNEEFQVVYGTDFVQLTTVYFSTADSWLGGAGNWSDNGKWSIGLPVPGFDVTIYSGGNDLVTLDMGSASVNSLGLGGGVNGFTSELTDAGTVQSLSIRQGLTIGQQGVLSLTGNGSSVSAASVSNSGSVFIGQGATVMTTAGNYSQSIGMTKVDGALVANGGQANFYGGTLLGNGGVVTGNVSMGGILAPGEGAGTAGMLTINGNYTQTATGIFDLDIGGYGQGTQFDFLKINGQAFLDGTLDINIINGFTLQDGDTFLFLLTDPGVFGQFATINGWDLGYGYFQVIYELNDVELAFTANNPVPEPDICLMLGSGLLGAAFIVRRRWLK